MTPTSVEGTLKPQPLNSIPLKFPGNLALSVRLLSTQEDGKAHGHGERHQQGIERNLEELGV